MVSASMIQKFEMESKKYKTILTQKQREIIYYRQLLKDNNIEYENPSRKQMSQDIQEPIEEEEEIFFSKEFEPQETEVNSGFPGFKINSRKFILKKKIKSKKKLQQKILKMKKKRIQLPNLVKLRYFILSFFN